jgi:hypothetical protein
MVLVYGVIQIYLSGKPVCFFSFLLVRTALKELTLSPYLLAVLFFLVAFFKKAFSWDFPWKSMVRSK